MQTNVMLSLGVKWERNHSPLPEVKSIRGLADETCPSWVNLQNLISDPKDDNLLNRVFVGSHAASCWNIGDTILFTSPDYKISNSFTTNILAIDETSGELTTADSAPQAFLYATILSSPDYAVEVATLHRSIVFDADDDDDQNGGGVMGGHMIIYHTPTIIQIMEGVEINNFGQQGNIGRYPIHFHMSLDVSGSLISKNVVHNSNQRGYVMHGTHNVQVVDNVAYEVFGHCFFTEDGIESGNRFEHNLGANIRKVSHVLDGANDDEPAVFWITNPQNHWIENVAAGSDDSGFWFDLRTKVRGPSANLQGASSINPNILSIGTFRDNTAHGNDFAGMRYYSPPWQPDEENQLLEGCKVYRNKSNGHFIHGNINLNFVGGITADNGQAYWFFVNNRIQFDGIKIVGLSTEYSDVLRKTNSGFGCNSGFELHPERHQGFRYSGTAMKATNLEFSGFGSCSGRPLQMSVTEIYDLAYETLEQISNITFLDEGSATTPISACNAESYGLSNIAIHDLDGSLNPNINGMPGFLVSDKPKITNFVDGCTPITPIQDSCLQFCEGICLRNVKIRVSGAFSLRNVEMVIRDNRGNEGVSGWARWEFDRFATWWQIFENTNIEREGFYLLALPSGAYNLSFRDKSTQETIWPDWAYIFYENPPESCDGYVSEDSIVLVAPGFDEARCSGELLDDGDFENIVDMPGDTTMGGWLQSHMHLALAEDGAGGSGHSLRVTGDVERWFPQYLAQYIDRSCIDDWILLEFSADIRFEDSNMITTSCDDDTCLTAVVDSIDEKGSSVPQFPIMIATISSTTEIVDGWYKMQGSLLIDEFLYFSDRVLFKIYQPLDGEYFVTDNISLRLTKVTPPTPPPTLPPAPTVSPQPTPQHTNIALGKLATQSSTASWWQASHAVDGDTDSFTHTDSMVDSWWMVDLGGTASISSITIYNRVEKKDRLNGAMLYILDYQEETVYAEIITEDGSLIIEKTFENMEGAYIRISLSGDFLTLAEVEVYGYVSNPQTLHPTIDPTQSIAPYSPSQFSAPPTSLPTTSTSSNPTSAPVNPTPSPVNPTLSPVKVGGCEEVGKTKWLFKIQQEGVKTKNCKWLEKQKSKRITKLCRSKKSNTEFGTPKQACPITCYTCGDTCDDDQEATFVFGLKKNGEALYKNCGWLKKKMTRKKKQAIKICKNKTAPPSPAKVCPITCAAC